MFLLSDLKSRFHAAHTGRPLRKPVRRSPRGRGLRVEPLESRLLLSISFPGRTFEIGGAAGAMVAADFDQDGHTDLAATHCQISSLSVLLGNGDGTMQAQQTFSLASPSRYLASGDFNGDGYEDLAATSQEEPKLSVVLGNGDGTFGDPLVTTIGGERLVPGDFNEDGRLDVAMVTSNGQAFNNAVTVLLGQGDGTFAVHGQLVVDSDAKEILCADFNNDGHDDLVTAHWNLTSYSERKVCVLLGDGDAGFQGPQMLDLGAYPQGTIVADDFNEDGNLDLAATCWEAVSVLLGNGDGTFQDHQEVPVETAPAQVFTADLNSDGHRDLITGGDRLSVALGNGDGTFQQHISRLQDNTVLMVTADLDEDGNADLATVSYENSEIVLILPGMGDGTFAPLSYPAGTSSQVQLTGADFDGDGYVDLATANEDDSSVSVLIARGDGSFEPPVRYDVIFLGYPTYIVAADLNGDSAPDLVVAASHGVGVLLNNGDGTFQGPNQYDTGSSVGYGIVAGDFNGDGYIDLAQPTRQAGSDEWGVSVLLGDGQGWFPGAIYSHVGPWFNSLAAADFNGDGMLDVAGCVHYSSTPSPLVDTVGVLFGNGDGTFGTAVHYGTALSPMHVAAADLNEDGWADLVTANWYGYGSSPSRVSVLLNNGDGTFGAHQELLARFSTRRIITADLDSDGHVDLVTVSEDSTVNIFPGNGNGTFATRIDLSGADVPRSVFAADLDGDGAKDLATADYTGLVTVFLNRGEPALPEAQLFVPGAIRYDRTATFYVKYRNTSDEAIPAPVFVVEATQGGQPGAIMTTDPSLVSHGFTTDTMPDGFSDTVSFQAPGDAAGLLQPGKTFRQPVYFAGWLEPWICDDAPPIHFRLLALTRNGPIELDSRDCHNVGPRDPNEKTGPLGFGDPGYVAEDELLGYRIDFENEASATAPAQQVTVFDQLDVGLDWTTFELTEIGFGNTFIVVPEDTWYYETVVPVNYNDEDFEVHVQAGVDVDTGQLVVSFDSIDPDTGQPPMDVMTGFLPPEDGTGRGQGHISYVIESEPGLATGTEIRNVAQIQFDSGEIIATNQVDPHDPSQGPDPAKEALVTIDAGPPQSSVSPLVETTTNATFLVQWSGEDDAEGSGIRNYDVYVSDSGKGFELWRDDTGEISAQFTGEMGHAYAFYSVATDNVGHREASPTVADASIAVVPPPPELEAGPDQAAAEGNPVGLPDAVWTFAGDPALLTLSVDWGDGTVEAGTLVPEPSGGGGTVAGTHGYAEDGTYAVTLTLSTAEGDATSDTLTVTVHNMAPTLLLNPVAAVNENGQATLTGTITDPGTLDTFTLDVNWGDPLSPINIEQYTYGASATGSQTITLTHQYLDDKPGGTPSDVYSIGLILTDDDMNPGTLDWDAALDSDGNAFWESTINATNARRWNFGTPISPVSAADSKFPGVWSAYHFSADGSGAKMVSWEELGFGSPNATNQDATFEVVFRPEDLSGNHVLLETGGNGDGTIVKLEGDQLTLRVQQYSPGGWNDGVPNDDRDVLAEVTAVLPDSGRFYHLVGTIDLGNDGIAVYVDGQPLGTAPALIQNPGPNFGSPGDLTDWAGGDDSGLSIANGSVAGAGDFATFNGDIARVRYYRNAVLDATEVEASYNLLAAGNARTALPVTVYNVAPVLVFDPVAPIHENGVATLTGTIIDPGTLDTFTLDINWGDPLSPGNVEQYTYGPSAPGSQTITLTHQYLDDNPTGTSQDAYVISAMVTDDDGGISSIYSRTVLADQPIAYWRLGEISGTTAVSLGSIGSAVNGTYVGGVTLGDDGLLVGDPDAAAAFDGLDDQVDIPNHPLINTGGPYTQRTAELWFRADNVADRQVLYEEGGVGRGLNIYLDSGSLYVNAWDGPGTEGGWGPLYVGTPVSSGTSYHVALVFDQPTGTITGYLNGASFGASTGVGKLSAHGGYIAIGAKRQDTYYHDGASTGAGNRFDGIIDEVALYGAALSPEQILAHYEAGAGIHVDVLNVPPTVEAGVDQSCAAGTAVDFAGSFTDPGSTDTHTIEWDFGDGNTDSGALTLSHVYADEGTYTVTLTVTDDDGGAGSDTLTVSVTGGDLAPTAAFSWSPAPQDEGSVVQFADESTSDPDAIVGWSWDFAGLGTSTEQNPSFTFTDDGAYTVTLTVTDDDGSTDTISHDVTVLDLAPTAAFTWSPQPQEEGSAVQFTDQSTSYPDDIIGWSWNFAGLGISTEQNPSFTFVDDGTYTVTLTVTDDDMGSDSVSTTVTVRNVAPILVFDPVAPIHENGVATLTGTITDPGTLDTFTLDLDWGDPLSPNNVEQYTYGPSATGSQTITLTHQYLDDNPGGTPSDDYTIRLMVRDDDVVAGTLDWHVPATLDWTAALDLDGNAFWESTVNATDARRWDFGGPTSPVSVTDSNLLGVSRAYHFSTGDSGATMASWQSLGFSGTNPTLQDATFELVFRPEDLSDNHVLLETGGNVDGTVVKLEEDELVFRVQRFGYSDPANDNFLEIRTTLDMAGVFYHFVGTINLANNEGSMYLNGQLIATQGTVLLGTGGPGGDLDDWAGPDASGLFIASSPGGVAGGNAGWSTFNGDIASVRYYRNDVLDAAEVEANYLAVVGMSTTVTVNNVAPTANDDQATTDEDAPVTIHVLDNDTDPAGPNDPLTVVAVTTTDDTRGTVEINPDGTVTYTPDAGFAGMATFTYTVEDDDGGTGTGTVSVTVRNLVDLSGRVFDDRDNDGQFDPDDGDNGLGNVVIELAKDGSVVASTETAADGTYDFQNLPAGMYTIQQETQPADYLDGLESTGDLGGDPASNGSTVDNSDSSAISSIVVGEPGTQLDGSGYDFAELLPASIQGLVWEDFNDDGEVDLGELAIEGVTIILTGTDDRSGAISLSQTTGAQGIFEFTGLRPGTYSVEKASQPAGFLDGQNVLGEVLEHDLPNGNPAVILGYDGVVDPAGEEFSGIGLVAGSCGVNYNFGERVEGGELGAGQTATIGFWQNKNGQALIMSLNGGPESTVLATYLADTFPNMYGGLDNFQTNEDIAAAYKQLFKRNAKNSPGGPPKLDAQVLAVALATFVTKESLAGLVYDPPVEMGGQTDEHFLFTDKDGDGVYEPNDGDIATIDSALIAGVESYGFDVTAGGVGSKFFNVGQSGDAFDGFNDYEDAQIIDLLLATDAMSLDGILYDDADADGSGDGEIDDLEAVLRTLANDVYSAINENGHI